MPTMTDTTLIQCVPLPPRTASNTGSHQITSPHPHEHGALRVSLGVPCCPRVTQSLSASPLSPSHSRSCPSHGANIEETAIQQSRCRRRLSCEGLTSPGRCCDSDGRRTTGQGTPQNSSRSTSSRLSIKSRGCPGKTSRRNTKNNFRIVLGRASRRSKLTIAAF
eukprot:767912-Hanusia_phi.AAC.1